MLVGKDAKLRAEIIERRSESSNRGSLALGDGGKMDKVEVDTRTQEARPPEEQSIRIVVKRSHRITGHVQKI
jgi:hypothetical protein